MPWQLQPELSFDENIQYLLQQRLGRLEQHIRAITQGDHRDGHIHDARKDCKRIRALLRLSGTRWGAAERQRDRMIRDIARSLASARDRFVLAQTLDALGQRHGIDVEVVSMLQAALSQRPEGNEIAIEVSVVLEQCAAVRDTLINRPQARPSETKRLRRGLSVVYQIARKRFKKVACKASSDAFHDWRKFVKYHLYQLHVVEPIWPEVMAARGREVDRLATLLGDLHDIDTLEDGLVRLKTADVGDTWDEVHRAVCRDRARWAAASQALGERLFIEPSRLFGRRMAHYWRRWRCESLAMPSREP